MRTNVYVCMCFQQTLELTSACFKITRGVFFKGYTYLMVLSDRCFRDLHNTQKIQYRFLR